MVYEMAHCAGEGDGGHKIVGQNSEGRIKKQQLELTQSVGEARGRVHLRPLCSLSLIKWAIV